MEFFSEVFSKLAGLGWPWWAWVLLLVCVVSVVVELVKRLVAETIGVFTYVVAIVFVLALVYFFRGSLWLNF